LDPSLPVDISEFQSGDSDMACLARPGFIKGPRLKPVVGEEPYP
jgi:hypothetical protein